jgi:sporulation protein YlmC with PRC-barrel domain
MSVTSEAKYIGSTVIDNCGNSIGRVRDVLFDTASNRPTWLVVKPGLMRSEHYVPTRGAYRTADEDVVVPYNRDYITSSPKAGHDHVMSTHERMQLAQYFGLDD